MMFTFLPINVVYQGWPQFFQEECTMINILLIIVSIPCFFLDILTLQRFVYILLAIILIRKVLAGGFCCNDIQLHGKTFIVTGANSGIGKEAAIEFARRGANLILACRDMQKAGKVASEIRSCGSSEVKSIKLDLCSFESIKSFANEVSKTFDQIDCLVNNAGIMMCPYSETVDGLEIQMGVNHFGHFLLTSLLLPLVRKSSDGRIINVSSFAHNWGKIPFDDFNYKKGYNTVEAYGNSKLANILHVRHLAKILKGSNVQVFSVHPGLVQTELGRHLPLGLGAVSSKCSSVVGKTAKEGAQTTIYCATEAVQQPTFYFADCHSETPSKRAFSDSTAEQLWKVSEQMVNIS